MTISSNDSNEFSNTLTIFFSWQSDTEAKRNANFIRSCLKKASISLETKYNIKIKLDEATRDVTGSPDIVSCLIEKISNCDVFISDATIVNSSSSQRKMPNPNVSFELGYAKSLLGDLRTIIIINSAYGGVDLLPFDFNHRRISAYSYSEEDSPKEPKEYLTGLLKNAIEGIIETNPKRATGHIIQTLSGTKSVDLITASRLLESMNIPVIYEMIDSLPWYVKTAGGLTNFMREDVKPASSRLPAT